MQDIPETRRVLDLLPCAIVWVDGPSIWMNSAAERITGYPRHALTTLDDYLNKTTHAGSPFSAGMMEPVILRMQCGDGQIRALEHESQSSSGDGLYVLRDVTARLSAEAADRRQTALLQRVSRLAGIGGWEVNLRTNEYYWSEQIYRLYGLDPQAGINEEIALRAYSEESRQLLVATSRESAESGRPWHLELPVRTPAGTDLWVRISGEVETENGMPVRAAGTIQDVTERRRMDAALLEARLKAEAASTAKGEFLANMSHEIRTPMNGVIGMTQLLLETPLDATQRDYAETVGNSANALLKVINDILDFSKIEAGKLELECIDMDLRDTVQDVARLLAIQAHAKNLELTLEIDANVPSRVSGDSGRLRQVLLNLGGNAVKFTHQGEVSIDVRMLRGDDAQSTVRIEVRDTGIGIPASRLASLFQPFSQVDSSTTRQFGGTGLGLSIVRRLVQLMGGETGMESREGIGSRFWFTAKFGAPTARQMQRPANMSAISGLRILVVDDNATNRRVLMAQLKQCGCEPASAASADEALQLMQDAADRTLPFDVALLDHQMPDADGAELGRRIIADAVLKSTRLILLTSLGRVGDGEFFAELGFAGYLAKPVGLQDLIDCLSLAAASSADVWHSQTQPIVTAEGLSQLRLRNGRRVLVAEDNAVNQKVARKLLETMGIKVEIAENGKAALAAYEKSKFDLILMDCQMPEMDGYEAAAEIRRRENGGTRIPIIALTAHAMKGADELSRAAGMDDHLTKPIDRKRLQSVIERFLPPQSDQAPRLAVATANAP